MIQAGSPMTISDPLPKGLFDDPIPPELRSQFVVREAPGIRFQMPS